MVYTVQTKMISYTELFFFKQVCLVEEQGVRTHI